MRTALFLLALVAMVVGYGANSASAAEPAKESVKATTSELPAALAALNPDREQVLNLSEAKEIRGEHWGGWGWGGWGWGGWGHWGHHGHHGHHGHGHHGHGHHGHGHHGHH